MSDVEFEENQNQYQYNNLPAQPEEIPTMIKFLAKKGWIKSKKQGYYILIGVCVVCILATIYVTLQNPSFRTSSGKKPYIEDIPANVKAQIPPDVLKTFPSKTKK